MDIDRLGLSGSPSFSHAELASDEQALFDRFPQDYRSFIEACNGGSADMLSDWYFPTGIEELKEAPSDTSRALFAEFWSVVSRKTAKPAYGKPKSVYHEHFDRHAAEDFLPNGVYAIGSSAKNALIVISLNADDFGVVYYWESQWEYPWFKSYFDKRAKGVSVRYGNLAQIVKDKAHPQHREAVDALNYASLVRVADTFEDFVAAMWLEEDEEETEEEAPAA